MVFVSSSELLLPENTSYTILKIAADDKIISAATFKLAKN
jgi:hypothetical protein